MNHKLDTDDKVFFYENDFYVLSNFSAFRVRFAGREFDTSEHAYQWSKFPPFVQSDGMYIRDEIKNARSAHDAFKMAEGWKDFIYPYWNTVRIDTMRRILRAKAMQHEYVYRKLMATGDRELIEDSWRDSFWGTGPNGDGQNMLGKLWMEIREAEKVNVI